MKSDFDMLLADDIMCYFSRHKVLLNILCANICAVGFPSLANGYQEADLFLLYKIFLAICSVNSKPFPLHNSLK